MRAKKCEAFTSFFFPEKINLQQKLAMHVNNVPFSFSLEGGNSEERLSSQASTQHNSFGSAVIVRSLNSKFSRKRYTADTSIKITRLFP